MICRATVNFNLKNLCAPIYISESKLTQGFLRENIMNTSSITLNNAKLTICFGRSKATFIKNLHFWINKAETEMNSIGIVHEGKRWIYNTAEEWGGKIGYSERQTQRIISDLLKEGIIYVEKLGRYKKTNTNFYTLNYEKLVELDITTPSFRKNTQESLKKNTSEITITNASSTRIIPQEITKPTNRTVQDMHTIWNSIFPNNQAIMTKNLGRFLYFAYKNNFSRKLDEWEKYCTVLSVQNPNGIPIEIAIQFNTINHYKNTQTQASTQIYQGHISQGIKSSAISNQLPESEIDTSKSQEMLDIWNRVFENKSTYTMNPSLQIMLAQSLKENFNSSLEEWRCHCLSIQSSSWIMRSEFKLHLSWAIKKETVDKIRVKEYGVKEVIPPKINHTDIVETHIAKMALVEDPFLTRVRRVFINMYGEGAYRSWIIPVDLQIENRQLVIISDKPLMREYPKDNYPEIFKYVVNNAPSKPSQQKNSVIKSLPINKFENICTRYKKTIKIIPGHCIPHDLRQRFTIDDDGYFIKVKTTLKYAFNKQNSVTLNEHNNVIDGIQDSFNQQTQQEISRPEEERREGAIIITTNTVLKHITQDRLPEITIYKEIGDIEAEATKNISPALSSKKIQYEDNNFSATSIKTLKNLVGLNNEYRHDEKLSYINFTPKNVVKARGALRHFVVFYNTVITNQQNNNLIKPKRPINDQPTFSTSFDESNYQVRYYYFRNIILEEKNIACISQNQFINNVFTFMKNKIFIKYTNNKLENNNMRYWKHYKFDNKEGEFKENQNMYILPGWYLNSKTYSYNSWRKYTQLQTKDLNRLFMKMLLMKPGNANRDKIWKKILQDTG